MKKGQISLSKGRNRQIISSQGQVSSPKVMLHSMVAYNVSPNISETNAALELAGICNVLESHISKVDRLSFAREYPPIVTELDDRHIMWSLIKILNQLKPRNTYAKPFWS